MTNTIRRLRGLVGTGLTWAVAWTGVGALLHAFTGGMVSPTVSIEVLGFSVLGFVGGAVFATGFMITEGRRRLDQLTLGRAGFWGAAAGLFGPLALLTVAGVFSFGIGVADVWQLLAGTAIAGTVSGTAMTAIARSAAGELTSGSPTGLPPGDSEG